MRLKTIWTLRPMSLRERLNRTGEWAAITIAHFLPRWLAYRSYIDTGCRYMPPNAVVPEVAYMEILERMER